MAEEVKHRTLEADQCFKFRDKESNRFSKRLGHFSQSGASNVEVFSNGFGVFPYPVKAESKTLLWGESLVESSVSCTDLTRLSCLSGLLPLITVHRSVCWCLAVEGILVHRWVRCRTLWKS